MKRKTVKIVILISVAVLILFSFAACAARFVFLAPLCYADNDDLTESENDAVKTTVLETIKNRLSVFGASDDLSDSDHETDQKHLLVLIDSDFMRSVKKENNEYVLRVQTYLMEPVSEDCVYEICVTRRDDGYSVSSFGLDP